MAIRLRRTGYVFVRKADIDTKREQGVLGVQSLVRSRRAIVLP